MSDLPPEESIDFGEEDEYPKLLGYSDLTLDGTVFAKVYSFEDDPFIGTGRTLDLTDLYSTLGVESRDPLDVFIESLLQPYDGFPLDKHTRVYYGINQLKAKLEGMRGARGLVSAIYMDDENDDILPAYIVYIDDSI